MKNSRPNFPLAIATGVPYPSAMQNTRASLLAGMAAVLITGSLPAAPPAPAKVIPLKESTAAVNALLVIELEGGEMAGFAQALTATAIDTGGQTPLAYNFNQDVGDSMTKALDAAVRGLQIRHKGWPRGQSVEFTFKEKYSPKDGPSAATACALILDSLITGDALDPAFAVTGDMNSDLSVQPVGGVPTKVNGAIKGGNKLVAIPLANRVDIEDMVVLEGYKALSAAQIFTISSFDHAKEIGRKEKSAEMSQSIGEFAKLQGGEIKLKTPEGKAMLEGILKRTPNHLSAELIHRMALGSAPTKLSLIGSIDTVEKTAAPFFVALREDKVQTINGPAFESAMTKLSRLQGKLDPKVSPYYLSVMDFLAFARRVIDKTITNRAESLRFREDLTKRIERVDSEWKKLTNDPKVVEAMKR